MRPGDDNGSAEPLTAEAIDHLLALDPETRAEWMLEDCARHEQAWGLSGQDGWVLFKLDAAPEGKSPWALPLWPRRELASMAARTLDEQAMRIGLEELLDRLLPEVKQRAWRVLAGPVRDEGLVLDAADFGRKLEDAWNEMTDEDA